jgi:hypothetical protein
MGYAPCLQPQKRTESHPQVADDGLLQRKVNETGDSSEVGCVL